MDSTNHLLFTEDLKLLARSEHTLVALAGSTKAFLQRIGLEMNSSKSATNVQRCSDAARYLEETKDNYLGVLRTGRA